MPYELSFTRRVDVAGRDDYINECCIGGDVVVGQLLPLIRERYEDVWTDQEDWGWFIWFRRDGLTLAVDVFTDDPETGAFRIHLTARRKRWLFGDQVVETPELDVLRDLVVPVLTAWVGGPVAVEAVERD